MFGAFEADVLTFPHFGAPPKEVLDAFAPDLVVGENLPRYDRVRRRRFEAIMSEAGKGAQSDARTSELRFSRWRCPTVAARSLHSHRTLVATGISIGAFYLLAEDITVLLLEPPTNWWTLAMLLGAMNRGATIWAGWDGALPHLPASLNYAVCGWDRAGLLLDEKLGRSSCGTDQLRD